MYVQYLHVHVPMNSKQLGLGFYLFLCVRWVGCVGYFGFNFELMNLVG
jgi:hypothetical protein